MKPESYPKEIYSAWGVQRIRESIPTHRRIVFRNIKNPIMRMNNDQYQNNGRGKTRCLTITTRTIPKSKH